MHITEYTKKHEAKPGSWVHSNYRNDKKTVFFYSLRPQTAIFVVSLHTALKWLIYFNFIFFGISLKFEVDDLLETKLY